MITLFGIQFEEFAGPFHTTIWKISDLEILNLDFFSTFEQKLNSKTKENDEIKSNYETINKLVEDFKIKIKEAE